MLGLDLSPDNKFAAAYTNNNQTILLNTLIGLHSVCLSQYLLNIFIGLSYYVHVRSKGQVAQDSLGQHRVAQLAIMLIWIHRTQMVEATLFQTISQFLPPKQLGLQNLATSSGINICTCLYQSICQSISLFVCVAHYIYLFVSVNLSVCLFV